jgi:hypothetical protein
MLLIDCRGRVCDLRFATCVERSLKTGKPGTARRLGSRGPRKPVPRVPGARWFLSLSLSLSVRDACAVMPVRVVGCHCFSNYPAEAEHRALERSSITSSSSLAHGAITRLYARPDQASPGLAPRTVRTLFHPFFFVILCLYGCPGCPS